MLHTEESKERDLADDLRVKLVNVGRRNTIEASVLQVVNISTRATSINVNCN